MTDLRPHVDLILTSLSFTRQKFESYPYQDFGPAEQALAFRSQRLADVDAAIAAVRQLRKDPAT